MTPDELQRTVDDLLLRIRGLVAVKDILVRRGAPARDVSAHQAEIERLREVLAQTISENKEALGAAA